MKTVGYIVMMDNYPATWYEDAENPAGFYFDKCASVFKSRKVAKRRIKISAALDRSMPRHKEYEYKIVRLENA